MEKNTWKTIAIISMSLFVILLFLNIWAVNYTLQEDEKYNECLYNVCSDYSDGYYEDGVCSCFSYDNNNELIMGIERYI